MADSRTYYKRQQFHFKRKVEKLEDSCEMGEPESKAGEPWQETDAGGSQDSQGAKIDPRSIFKSKRYRDKLRTEVKALEALLPIDKSAIHRKLDSQTVFRLCIAYFRTKHFLQADLAMKKQNESDAAIDKLIEASSLLELLDGFLLVVTSDGTILFVSPNILQQLGFNQVDLKLRCLYGIVHPDDHEELKMILEHTLSPQPQRASCMSAGQTEPASRCRLVSFLCRIKCFSGSTTGYMKMHCAGHMRSFPGAIKSQRTSNQVLFTFCRPFVPISADVSISPGYQSSPSSVGLWTKHELDLRFKQMDEKVNQIFGYKPEELMNKSLYEIIHPEDLSVFRSCHKSLIHTEEIQTLYFRAQQRDGSWLWLHTRGKVVFKSSKKYSIVFTHCPVREEDSTYIQQEAVIRRRYAVEELMTGSNARLSPSANHYQMMVNGQCSQQTATSSNLVYGGLKEDSCTSSLHDPHGHCPSSWHATCDRHSPVFPNTQLPTQNTQNSYSFNPISNQSKKRKIGGKKCQTIAEAPLNSQWTNSGPRKWMNQGVATEKDGIFNRRQICQAPKDNQYCDYSTYQNCWPTNKYTPPSCHQQNHPVPYTMVIEGRLTINTNQAPSSCCFANDHHQRSNNYSNNVGYSGQNTTWNQQGDAYSHNPSCMVESEANRQMNYPKDSQTYYPFNPDYSEHYSTDEGVYDYPEIYSCMDQSENVQCKTNKMWSNNSDCMLQGNV